MLRVAGGGLWVNVQDGVKVSVGGDCVFVVNVIVGSGYFKGQNV
jgi:hypothetical protein